MFHSEIVQHRIKDKVLRIFTMYVFGTMVGICDTCMYVGPCYWCQTTEHLSALLPSLVSFLLEVSWVVRQTFDSFFINAICLNSSYFSRYDLPLSLKFATLRWTIVRVFWNPSSLHRPANNKNHCIEAVKRLKCQHCIGEPWKRFQPWIRWTNPS